MKKIRLVLVVSCLLFLMMSVSVIEPIQARLTEDVSISPSILSAMKSLSFNKISDNKLVI